MPERWRLRAFSRRVVICRIIISLIIYFRSRFLPRNLIAVVHQQDATRCRQIPLVNHRVRRMRENLECDLLRSADQRPALGRRLLEDRDVLAIRRRQLVRHRAVGLDDIADLYVVARRQRARDDGRRLPDVPDGLRAVVLAGRRRDRRQARPVVLLDALALDQPVLAEVGGHRALLRRLPVGRHQARRENSHLVARPVLRDDRQLVRVLDFGRGLAQARVVADERQRLAVVGAVGLHRTGAADRRLIAEAGRLDGGYQRRGRTRRVIAATRRVAQRTRSRALVHVPDADVVGPGLGRMVRRHRHARPLRPVERQRRVALGRRLQHGHAHPDQRLARLVPVVDFVGQNLVRRRTDRVGEAEVLAVRARPRVLEPVRHSARLLRKPDQHRHVGERRRARVARQRDLHVVRQALRRMVVDAEAVGGDRARPVGGRGDGGAHEVVARLRRRVVRAHPGLPGHDVRLARRRERPVVGRLVRLGEAIVVDAARRTRHLALLPAVDRQPRD